MDLYEFKVGLVYIVSSKPGHTNQEYIVRQKFQLSFFT